MSFDWQKMYQGMFGGAPSTGRCEKKATYLKYYRVNGKRRTKIVITRKDALDIAKELLRTPKGYHLLLLKHPCGTIFFNPADTPNTVYRLPNVWERLGVIKGPGEKCTDLGLDPNRSPCHGPRWDDADLFELVQTLADRIYEHPERWIKPGWED